MQRCRQVTLYKSVCRLRHAYEVGRGEYGDNRYCHYDGIKALLEHSQAHTQRCYDETELAYLCQRKSAFHGDLKGLACEQHAQGAEQYHAADNDYGQYEYRVPIAGYDARIHHHAHRYEEDGAKQVFNRLHHMFYAFGHNGARYYGTTYETAQFQRESAQCAEHRHTETQAHGYHKQGLLVHEAAATLEKGGYEPHSDHIPQYEVEH